MSVRGVTIRLPEKYSDLLPVFNDIFTKIMSQFDIRDDGSVFASSLYYDQATDTLTVGNANISNSDINDSDIGTGTDINEGAKVTNQRVLPTLNYANAGSIQNTIPLTASADSLSAEIQIGAHTVHFGGVPTSFNSGSVVGLLTETDYRVYCDDPDLDGGAVIYFATTSTTLLADNLSRYFVGSIRTPLSTISAALSAATNANPCVVTTGAPHGFGTGDQVTFVGVGGMTQLNALSATAITVGSPTTFSLNGVNSTAFGIYTSGGTVTRVATDGLYAGGAGGGSGYIYDFASYGQPL